MALALGGIMSGEALGGTPTLKDRCRPAKAGLAYAQLGRAEAGPMEAAAAAAESLRTPSSKRFGQPSSACRRRVSRRAKRLPQRWHL